MAKVIVKNKNAYYDYAILDVFEAGIELSGWEVKSIRAGKVVINNTFCAFKANELYVINMHISNYMSVPGDEQRPRKLLLNQAELKKIRSASEVKGKTIVPTTLKWSSRGLVKLDIAIGQGKTERDKRETIKARDEARSMRTKFKGM